jgi:cadmium resistance protein CadD (predicted permease)
MEIILTGVIAFTSTNIDDIFLLTLFYGNPGFRHGEIMAGQFLGISTLIALSLVGSLIGLIVDPSLIGLLGLIPIFLGIKGIWALWKNKDDKAPGDDLDEEYKQSKVFTVAGVTIANGGDNIGIYVPLFATFDWADKITMVTVFLVMTFFWCMTAKYFVKHPYVARAVGKYGHMVTPFVLVLLGLFILYENGTLELLSLLT